MTREEILSTPMNDKWREAFNLMESAHGQLKTLTGAQFTDGRKVIVFQYSTAYAIFAVNPNVPEDSQQHCIVFSPEAMCLVMSAFQELAGKDGVSAAFDKMESLIVRESNDN